MNNNNSYCGKFKRTSKRYVKVELRHDSAIGIDETGFVSDEAGAEKLESIHRVLEAVGTKREQPLLPITDASTTERIKKPSPLTESVTADFAHAAFAQIVPKRSADAQALASRLNRLGCVWKAVASTMPIPAGRVPEGRSTRSRNYEPGQGYLHSAPYGIGSLDLRGSEEEGWDGDGVTICDIESGWNRSHEDLPWMRNFGGEIVEGDDSIEHGTAVMGMLIARGNASGLVGMVPKARGAFHSDMINGYSNPSSAVLRSVARLRKGDVIMIELHDELTPGRGDYVAMQHDNDMFSAIRTATDAGIVVVEAAGNGNQNFDDAKYNNTGLQKDAGAIVVGAGVPPTNYAGYDGDQYGLGEYGYLGPPRSRIFFSNYGKIVNLQAWGWNVTTLGYGDAQGGSDHNRWYSHRFAGTSSATPIIAGAVAAIQSSAMHHYGEPLSPRRVRDILIRSGSKSKQVASPDAPLSQHIGPQPDLYRAFGLF